MKRKFKWTSNQEIPASAQMIFIFTLLDCQKASKSNWAGIEIEQSQDLIKSNLIKDLLLSNVYPFITKCQELIKMLPARFLNDLGFSLSDNPYLPSAFGGKFAHDYQAPVQGQVQPYNRFEINKDLFKDEDDFITPLNLPQAPVPTGSSTDWNKRSSRQKQAHRQFIQAKLHWRDWG